MRFDFAKYEDRKVSILDDGIVGGSLRLRYSAFKWLPFAAEGTSVSVDKIDWLLQSVMSVLLNDLRSCTDSYENGT